MQSYANASDEFLRDQALSIGATISRQERLQEQKARLEAAPPVMRPVVVLSNPDARVMRGAWPDFEPAVPVTAAGFVWAALGLFLAGGLVSMIRQLAGIARKRARQHEAALANEVRPPVGGRDGGFGARPL